MIWYIIQNTLKEFSSSSRFYSQQFYAESKIAAEILFGYKIKHTNFFVNIVYIVFSEWEWSDLLDKTLKSSFQSV